MYTKRMRIEDVIIPRAFAVHAPSETKIARCRDAYNRNGQLDRDIVVNHNNVIIDGYVALLVAKEAGIEEIQVSCSDTVPRGGRTTHNGGVTREQTPSTFVYGVHEKCRKVFCWHVAGKTKNKQFLEVGNKAVVSTKYGNQLITITRIDNVPPEGLQTKPVLRCLNQR